MVGAELVAENLASLLSGIARGVCPLVFSTAFPFVRLSGLSRFSGSMNKQTRQRISPPSGLPKLVYLLLQNSWTYGVSLHSPR
jgi:hypothetical protein